MSKSVNISDFSINWFSLAGKNAIASIGAANRFEPGPEDVGQPGLPGSPPEVEVLSHGYQYLTELRYDLIEPVSELLRKHIQALDLPLRSLEVEYGPSQFEFTFGPQDAMKT